MPKILDLLDESDALAQIEAMRAECSALEAQLGASARPRPTLPKDDALLSMDILTSHRACLRVALRTTGGQPEANRSRPLPHPTPKPSDPMPTPPARPTGGTVSLTEQCRLANAPRLAAEEAERAKARAVIQKLDSDRQAAIDAKKATEAREAAEYARLNPSLTEQCLRANGQS
jgi:hypothetical protein